MTTTQNYPPTKKRKFYHVNEMSHIRELRKDPQGIAFSMMSITKIKQ